MPSQPTRTGFGTWGSGPLGVVEPVTYREDNHYRSNVWFQTLFNLVSQVVVEVVVVVVEVIVVIVVNRK